MLAAANGDDLEDGFEIQANLSGSEEDIKVVVQDLTKKKKRKRKVGPEEKTVKRRKVNETGDASTKLAAFQSPAVQTEYFNMLQEKIFHDGSPLDLDTMKFRESSFVDTREYGTERDMERLPEFISQVTPTLEVRLGQKPANKGAPTLLFITGAALRAAEITRLLRNMRGTKGGEIAKLFAKHFKLEEREFSGVPLRISRHAYGTTMDFWLTEAEYLGRTAIAGGVGTAGRIGRLLGETRSLSLKALTHIIVDASHRDAKMRTIFDIPETRTALIRDVLGNQALKNAIDSGKVTVVLF